MSAWALCALCALVLVKPQEFVGALSGVPVVHLAFGLTVALAVVDVVRGRIEVAIAPQVPYAVAFLAWALATTAVKRPDVLAERAASLSTVAGVYVAIAIVAGSSRGLRALAVTYVACAVFVTASAVAQAFQPYGCMLAEPEDWEGKGELVPDGRPCETNLDCRKDPPLPDGNYRCERAGPWRTATIDGRVRFRGSLADPNELSLMAAMGLPFAVALAERRRRAAPPPGRSRASTLPVLLTDRLLGRVAAALRAIPVVVVIVATGAMVALSRSRGGLIVYLVVLGLSFIRWSGASGVVLACIAAPPMILLGGRSGTEATESADERLSLLKEAFELIRQTKGFGVGAGQFGDESSIGMTAHNAYVLAAAETGLLGMCLFALLLYASLKVPLAIWLGDHDVDAVVARTAPAIFISLAGALVGIFFLSWAYKDVLYIVLGASAALHGAARSQDARVSVRVSAREVAIVCAGMFGVLAALNVVLRIVG